MMEDKNKEKIKPSPELLNDIDYELKQLQRELNEDIVWPKIRLLLVDLSLALLCAISFLFDVNDPFKGTPRYLLLVSACLGGISFLKDSSFKYLVGIWIHIFGTSLYTILSALLLQKEAMSIASLSLCAMIVCIIGLCTSYQLYRRLLIYENICDQVQLIADFGNIENVQVEY